MTLPEKFDKTIAGIITGLLLPIIVGLIIFLFSSGNHTMRTYLQHIVEANIVTHAITLCVFPNVFIFLMFNRLDMLKAARGVLAITIVWAVLVFAVKFLG